MNTILPTLLGIYGVIASVFLISENRRPQATLAWLLVFFFAPGIGVVVYILFGRPRKAFSKQSKLRRQNIEPAALQLMSRSLSRQDGEISRLARESPSHKKLMLMVRHNSHSALTTRNYVQIQQDASTFYPNMIRDMEAARHSIHLQYFIWRSDAFTEGLKDILTAKAKAGIEVRLLYDPIGSRTLSRRYIKELRSSGVRLSPTSPRYQLHTISYRNHRKLTVIDGEIGYTGGMNIGQEHLDGGTGFDYWRDTQLRIAGDGAALLQAVFMVDWYNAVGENLFAPAYFPTEETQAVPGDTPVQILTSGPDSEWEAIRQLYFFMIITAERHVLLQSPYFVLDATIAEALKSAALSGVEVKVMLSAQASGNKVPGWAGNTFIRDVMKAGVRVFLYGKGYLHAKTISIDSKICSIGSANIDIRSFSINYELNAVLYNERLAHELEQDFERDLAYCTEFDVTEYEKRNFVLRFRDSVARLLSPLL